MPELRSGPGGALLEPSAEHVGFSIEGLRLCALLAKGGFAEVWEAEQVSLGRKVAVKILRSEHLGEEQMVQLFEQESRVLARLNHFNVVQVIDRGATQQGPYFVMEYVEGETLQQLIAKGRLTRQRALTILLHATKGLAYAHRNGVVHRDVKPANILISRSGQVKLTDFGIAVVKAVAREQEGEETGGKKQALGTRAYMAPEQRVSFDEVGPQADVYSMGVILHRVVTGKLPPAPGRIDEDARMPSSLRPILERSLAEKPELRYPDANALYQVLVDALQGAHLDDGVRMGAARTFGSTSGFELLDVIRQDERRSVYLVRRGGPDGERIVVKRYVHDPESLRTVRDLCRVEHPNIVRIHAVGERDSSFIMLMEYLSGGDLRERLVKPHTWQHTADVGRQVARALAFAARQGIIHGNLRPSNVLFDARGVVRVTDFGLPEHYRGEEKRNWYAPPGGATRSTETDLYALGAILYEMLFARAVPSDADPFESPAPLGALPLAFESLLRRLLSLDAENYSSPEDLVRDLDRLIEEQGARGAKVVKKHEAPSAQPREGGQQDQVERTARMPRVPISGLLGLGGLLLVWLLQSPSVQTWLESLLAP